MEQTKRILVKDEADAWEFLRQAAYDKDFGKQSEITFSDWPRLEIKFEGKRFEKGLLPSSVAKSMHELQKDLNNSYKLVKFGSESGGSLSAEEKSKLEIKFKVTEGSLNINADIGKILDIIINNMDGADLRRAGITLAVIGIGYGGLKLKEFVEKMMDHKAAEMKHEEVMHDKETTRVTLPGKNVDRDQAA